jgi:hypothetical protein
MAVKKIAGLLLWLGLAGCERTATAPGPIRSGDSSPAALVVRPDSIVLFSKGALARAAAGVVAGDGRSLPSLDGDIVWSVRDQSVIGNAHGTLGAESNAFAKQEGHTWLIATAITGGRSFVDSVSVRVKWVSSATNKPTWTFRYGAVVTQSTLALYSSMDVLKEQLNATMASVNAVFNTLGAFSGHFAFSIDSVYSIPDGSTQFPVVQPGSPLAGYVIFNASASSHFNPATRNVIIGEAFNSPRFARVVAHELAHARGAVDLYFATVPPSEDPDGRGYFVPSALMNDNAPIWDTYSQLILERNAANTISENGWGTPPEDFPATLSIQVVTASGTPVRGAAVTTYAYAFGKSLEQPGTAVTGTTDDTGMMRFAVNPFLRIEQRGRTEFRCRLGDCAHVIRVVVQQGARTAQTWLAYWDVVAHQMVAGTDTFTRRIIIGGPSY